MENQSTKDPILWTYIGKFGILIALIWGCIQIYNYTFKAEDYQSIANGNHSFYEISPIHANAIDKSVKYQAAVRTIINNDGKLINYNLDSLVYKFSNTKNWLQKNEFELYVSEASDSNTYHYSYYNEIWTFNIKNSGSKPLKELSLELPFEGSYKIILPNNIIKNGNFKNKISIGELRSSYEAKIICWTNNLGYTFDDEEKSRFTHKYGWFGIKYPVQVTGFIAWNKKNDDIPFIIISSIMLIIAFGFGATAGVKSYKELQEKNKLKNISELPISENEIT